MRYWEDFTPGEVITHRGAPVTAEAIIAFAKEYDPQPFHLDEDAARDSLLGGLCASGWHTCALLMRLIYDGYVDNSSSMGGPGLEELKWLKPVRPGDVLELRATCLETRLSKSRPEMGIVKFSWDLFNQTNDHVLTCTGISFFGRHEPAAVTP